MGESDNDVDDALDLEEGITNAFMGCQSAVDGRTNVGEESGRILPYTTINWTTPPVKTKLDEPESETVNNPCTWSEFTFCPVFAKGGGIYKRNALPTGVIPLSQDSSGTRKINGCEFHYNDWYDGVGPHRTPMDDTKQFPPEHKGCLEKDVLRNLGLTKHMMVVQDDLFFSLILLPICDFNSSGIVDDTRQNYFIDVETFSYRYAFDIGILGSYSHNFKVPTIEELVKVDGVVIHDGVRGGSDDTLYRR